jgi:MOSC domain-containing protein YiiM
MDKSGVLEDKHYGKNIDRSVLITSTKAYLMAKEENIFMEHGSLGENIVIDYNLDLLNPGDKLQAGEVILEIVQNCTLCNHLSKIDKKLPKLLSQDRGVFAKVIKGGKLSQNDKVYLYS